MILKIMSIWKATEVVASEHTQSAGLDDGEMGEQAYDMEEFPNSVEVNRQVTEALAAPHIHGAHGHENHNPGPETLNPGPDTHNPGPETPGLRPVPHINTVRRISIPLETLGPR